MTLARVTLGLFAKDCVTFDSFALARVAREALRPWALASTVTGWANHIALVLHRFQDTTLLHDFVKADFYFNIKISAVKELFR